MPHRAPGRDPGSGSILEPIGQEPRQPGCDDLAPGLGDVVGDAANRDPTRGAIPDRVTRARVAIARLADAAHVHEVAPAAFERDVERAGSPDGPRGAERPVRRPVGMPDEAE